MARYVNPAQQYLYTDPISNVFGPVKQGKLQFFKSQTNTPIITYKDSLLTIPNTNPVILDDEGRTPNIFFEGSARVILADQNDVQIWERDPVGGENEFGQLSLWDQTVIYNSTDYSIGSDDKIYKSLSDDNQGNDPTTSPTQWEEVRFIGVWNTNVLYPSGVVVQTNNGDLWKAVAQNIAIDPMVDSGANWLPAIDGSKVPEIIELKDRDVWNGESAAFNVLSNRKYQIDASGAPVDAALATSYNSGDEIIVHNESVSTNPVRLTNTALTLRGPSDTISPSDNLVLSPGDTAHIAMKTTTEGEFV